MDPEIFIIKGCDRLSNLKSLKSYAESKSLADAARIFNQTRGYYLPLIRPLDYILTKQIDKEILKLSYDFQKMRRSDGNSAVISEMSKSYKSADFALHSRYTFRKPILERYGLTEENEVIKLIHKNHLLVRTLRSFPNLPGFFSYPYIPDYDVAARVFEDSYVKYITDKIDDAWLCSYFSGEQASSHRMVYAYFLPEMFRKGWYMKDIEINEKLKNALADHNLAFRRAAAPGEDYYYMRYDPMQEDIDHELVMLNRFFNHSPTYILFDDSTSTLKVFYSTIKLDKYGINHLVVDMKMPAIQDSA